MRSILRRTTPTIGEPVNSPRLSWRLSLLLLAVLVLGACSRVELIYDNADWFVYRWTIDLLDANSDQKADWRDRFEILLADHRELLLPQLVAFLREIETQAKRGLDDERLGCLIDRSDDLYQAHARLAVPIAVDILGGLSPDQLDHLAGRLVERNAEYADNYLDDDLEARRKARVERYVESVERWTGQLTDTQRMLMANAIAEMPDTAEPWLAYRRAQQQRLLSLLRNGASRDELASFLESWWIELADRPSSLVQAADTVKRQSIALTLQIDASLDAAQRNRFATRVGELHTDLGAAQTLAAAAPAELQKGCG